MDETAKRAYRQWKQGASALLKLRAQGTTVRLTPSPGPPPARTIYRPPLPRRPPRRNVVGFGPRGSPGVYHPAAPNQQPANMPSQNQGSQTIDNLDTLNDMRFTFQNAPFPHIDHMPHNQTIMQPFPPMYHQPAPQIPQIPQQQQQQQPLMRLADPYWFQYLEPVQSFPDNMQFNTPFW